MSRQSSWEALGDGALRRVAALADGELGEEERAGGEQLVVLEGRQQRGGASAVAPVTRGQDASRALGVVDDAQ